MNGRLFVTNGYFLRTKFPTEAMQRKTVTDTTLQEMRAAKREHALKGRNWGSAT